MSEAKLVPPVGSVLRRVVASRQMSGGISFMQCRGGTPKKRWWRLELECGHVEERGVHYKPQNPPLRGWAMIHHPPSITELLPPPKRVQCVYCKQNMNYTDTPSN